MGYRPDRKTIPIDEARAILAVHGEPVTRTERVAVVDASGRVLARALVADRDVPPFARAAMDGYAVRATDTSGASRDHGIELRVVETVFSGMTPTRPIEAGTCAAIATGAPIPDGADAVVMSSTRRATAIASASSRPFSRASTSAAPAATSSPARLRSPKERSSRPRRLAVASALGVTGIDVLRPAARRDSFDRRRDRRAWRPAAGRADLRREHDGARGRGRPPMAASQWWRRARGDDREALTRAFDACLQRGPGAVLGRKLGRRARLRPRNPAARADGSISKGCS